MIRGKKFPWFDEPDISEQRGFLIRQIPDSDCFILTPSAKKFSWEYDDKNPYGENSELNWRSSILDSEGYEISGGYPKFFNMFEKYLPDGSMTYIDTKISEAIQNKTAILTKKEDGSLIIRSVYNNRVIFRTRGSYHLPQVEGVVNFEEKVINLIYSKYRNLFDATILPEYDLLFEFVSPENRIVIPYENEELIFLHAKDKKQKFLSWEKLQELSLIYHLHLVEEINKLKFCQTPKELKDVINQMETSGEFPYEGLVVRSPEGFMAKIKGEQYLAQHKLKNVFNYEKMVEIIQNKQINDIDHLKIYLQEDLLLDWETLSGLDEMFDKYQIRLNKYISVLEDIENFVFSWKPYPENNNVQKQFALDVKDREYSFLYFSVFNLNKNKDKLEQSKKKLFDEIVLKGK